MLTSDDTSSEIVKQNGKLRIVNGVPVFKSHLTKAIGGYRELNMEICETDFNKYSSFTLVTDGFYNLFSFQENVNKIINAVDTNREIQKIRNDIKDDLEDDASLAILILNSTENIDIK